MRVALHIAPEVEAAVAAGRPVVALESTVFSRLGLPGPAGAEALRRSLEAVTTGGAVPALTAVLDGVARVGVDKTEFDAVLGAARKAGERDLPVAVAQRWPAAGTTVSASVALAAAAGIPVFATGAIGGVHRDWARTGDESADLGALARHPVVTVCAGAKSFLALAQTLERLETLGVPVIGLATDERLLLPAQRPARAPPGGIRRGGGGGGGRRPGPRLPGWPPLRRPRPRGRRGAVRGGGALACALAAAG